MRSTMPDYPLTLQHFLWRSTTLFPTKEIVSRRETGRHRYTYADFGRRVAQLAHAIRELGVGPGDRVGTLAWNNYRHLELYFAVPCSGAVLHTLNPRLFPEHLEYVINDAEDKVIFVDASVVPMLQRVVKNLKGVKHFVVMSDGPSADGQLQPLASYEELIAGRPTLFPWPDLNEQDAAAMCYTSGTTGKPKGAVHVHGGFLVKVAAEVAYQVDCKPGDVLHWVTDMGWIMGPWETVGTLALGGTVLLYEGAPAHPGPDRLWALLDRASQRWLLIIDNADAFFDGVGAPMLGSLAPYGVGFVRLGLDGPFPLLPRALYGVLAAISFFGLAAVLWRFWRSVPIGALIFPFVPLYLAWRSLQNYFGSIPLLAMAGDDELIVGTAAERREHAAALAGSPVPIPVAGARPTSTVL